MTSPLPDRIGIVDAAEALGVSIHAAYRIVARRGMQSAPDETGRSTWARVDVDAEVERRAGYTRQSSQPKPGSGRTVETFTKFGAERLAQRVRDYWERRGLQPRIWIEPAGAYVNALRTADWWVVRSNMVDGRPAK